MQCSSKRISGIVNEGIDLVAQTTQKLDYLKDDSNFEAQISTQDSTLISKRTQLIQKYTQVLYQDVFAVLKEYQDEKTIEGNRKESFDNSTIISQADKQERIQPDLTIQEHHDFIDEFLEKAKLKKMASVSQ